MQLLELYLVASNKYGDDENINIENKSKYKTKNEGNCVILNVTKITIELLSLFYLLLLFYLLY